METVLEFMKLYFSILGTDGDRARVYEALFFHFRN